MNGSRSTVGFFFPLSNTDLEKLKFFGGISKPKMSQKLLNERSSRKGKNIDMEHRGNYMVISSMN